MPSRPSSPIGEPTPSWSFPAAPANRPAATRLAYKCASHWTTSIASPTAFPASIKSRPCLVRRHGSERSAYLYLDRVRRPHHLSGHLEARTDQGRFFNGAEDQQRAHVCVIGSEAKTKLFSGEWALGETIRLNGELFTVIGVLEPKMQEGDDNDINRTDLYPLQHHQRPGGYHVPGRNLVQLSRRQ